MNTPILSSKGTNKMGTNGRIIMGIFMGIIGFILLCMFLGNSDLDNLDTFSTIMIVFSVVFFAGGVFSAVWWYECSKSYIDIFEDHIEGKAMQGIRLQNLYIKKSQIKNVTTRDSEIYIHSDMGEFKILANKEIADKIFMHYKALL